VPLPDASSPATEPVSQSLPIEFLYPVPRRGATIHTGDPASPGCAAGAFAVDYQADRPSCWLLRPNIEGDLALSVDRLERITFRGRHDAAAPVRAQLTVRGDGWLASHSPLWTTGEIPVGEFAFALDLIDFRVAQLDPGPVAFYWELQAPHGGQVHFEAIEATLQSATQFLAPRVDRFGQRIHGQWSGKVQQESELHADRDEPMPAPVSGRSPVGAWAGGPDLPGNGFFQVKQVEGVDWLVAPDGGAFLSFGPCCASVGPIQNIVTAGREELWAELPPREGDGLLAWRGAREGDRLLPEVKPLQSFGHTPESDVVNFAIANLVKKYGPDWHGPWCERTEARLRSLGMNTLACWSDLDYAARSELAYIIGAERLAPLGLKDLCHRDSTWSASPVPDAFDPRFEERMDGVFAPIAEYRDDPRLLGWFVGNEQAWNSIHSPFAFPMHWKSRVVFFDDLERKYGSIASLNQAWGTRFASFAHLRAIRRADNPPGLSPEGVADCDDMLRRFADRYFRKVREELLKADPNHLFWGCRFLALPPHPAILAGATPHMDVVSINWYLWYKQTTDDVAPFLTRWHELTGKPLAITEYSFEASDARGLACRNLCISQAERARLAEAFTRAVFRLPFVVGAHWFQWIDQPITGRALGDGERANFGIIDVVDREHPELCAAMRAAGEAMYPEHGA